MIRDKHTGLHRGCAFVTYWQAADAETAQEALHDKFTFPGGRRPAQVKPAEPSVPENKLFIGMLSRKAGETEVRELFDPFGEVREIYMIRNADGSSKCAAFLRYVKREAAVIAIDSLNQSIVMDGATRPLIVKFADNKLQRQARLMRNNRRDHILATMRGPPPFQAYQVCSLMDESLCFYFKISHTLAHLNFLDATGFVSPNDRSGSWSDGSSTSTLLNTWLWICRWQFSTPRPSTSSAPIHVST